MLVTVTNSKMIIIFLDIDGVVNCATTPQRHGGFIGIDPYMSLLINRIIWATDAKVVLSSTWRLDEESRQEVRDKVCDFIDITPQLQRTATDPRGIEIKAWLDAHPDVTKYAILDDDSDMLPEQMENFFKTSWQTGITDDIAKKVTEHLTIKK